MEFLDLGIAGKELVNLCVIVVRADVVRLQGNGFSIRGDGFVELALGPKGAAEVPVRLGIVGLEDNRLAV